MLAYKLICGIYGLTVMLSFATQTINKSIDKVLDRADLLYRGTQKKYRIVTGLWNNRGPLKVHVYGGC